MPNGNTIAPFYHYAGRDFIAITTIDRQEKYICVGRSRVSIDEVMTEFPTGGAEVSETPRDATKRGLREEAGSVTIRQMDLGSLYVNPAMGTNCTHCFPAKDCGIATAQELDATECVVYLHLGESELRWAIEDSSSAQAVHLVPCCRIKELREGR